MNNLLSSVKVFNLSALKLLLIIMTPSFIFAYFQFSSLFFGLILVFIFIFFTSKKISVKFSKDFIFTFLVLICYSFIAVGMGGDFLKVFSSAFLLFLMVFFLVSSFRRSDYEVNNTLISSISLIYFLFLALGFLALLIKFPYGGYSFRHGSVFPFAEYSHFAIAFCFFALLYQFACKNNKGIIHCLPTFILGVTFPNLTTIIVGVLQLFMIRTKYKLLIFILSAFIIFPIVYFFMQDYVLSRLVFSEENRNLSNLVYLQGAETALNSLLSTYGLGLGFQNIGAQEPGYFTELIRTVTNGEDLNRLDGGFLAAKIISEFGLLGVLFCIVVVVNFFRVCRIVWFYDYPNRFLFLLYAASSGQIMVELFVRGYGYFSPGFIIFLSLYFLRSKILP